MEATDIRTDFQKVKVNGIDGLFLEGRACSTPAPICFPYRYFIRGCDDDSGIPATIEIVCEVNRYGVLYLKEEIPELRYTKPNQRACTIYVPIDSFVVMENPGNEDSWVYLVDKDDHMGLS